MDCVTDDDRKAWRGLQMLEGKSEGPFKDRGLGKPAAKAQAGRAARGLDIGRRHLVVVKPNPQDATAGGSSSSKKSGSEHVSQPVRVVDHGENQRLAFRQLFDAEIILRSYEEQIEYQNELIQNYQTLLLAHGLMPKDYDVQAAADQETKKAKALGLANSTMLLAEEADAAQARRHRKLEEQEEADRERAGEAPEEIDYDTRKIPFWLRNDERSRKFIEDIKQHLMRKYNDEGQLTSAVAVNHLWQCGMDFAIRWGGRVAEELLAQNEAIEEGSRKTRREALKETSTLRQHIRNMERKYKDLLGEAKKLHKQLRDAQRRALPRGGSKRPTEPAPIFEELPQKQAHKMASDIVAQWMGHGGGAGGGMDMAEPASAYNSEGGSQGGWDFPGGPTDAYGGRMSVGTPDGRGGGGGAHGGPNGQGGRTSGTNAIGQDGFRGGNRGGRAGGSQMDGGSGWMGGQGQSGQGGPGGPGGGHDGGGGGGGSGRHGNHLSVGGGGGHGNGGHGGQLNVGGGGGVGALGGGGGGFADAIGRSHSPGRFTGRSRMGSRESSPSKSSSVAAFDANRFDNLPIEGDTEYRSLEDDEHIDFNLDKLELDQMDHEIFEPLDMFDGDMKEMLIDAVNEKVRRILTLDPSKFQNGKLPFGLRPDNMAVGLDELNRLRHIIQQLQDELDGVRKERDLLKSRLEAMEGRMAILQKAPAVIQRPSETPRVSLMRGRSSTTIVSPASPSPRSPTGRPSVQDPGLITQEEFDRLLAQALEKATKQLKDRIADLEARLREMERLLKQSGAKIVEVIREVPVERDGSLSPNSKAAAKRREAQLQEALRVTQDLLRKVLGMVSKTARKTSKGQAGVEELIGKEGASEVAIEEHVKAVPPFEVWTKDVLKMVRADLMNRADSVPTDVEAVVPEETEKAPTPPTPPTPPPDHTEELNRLRKVNKAQEEEIARLLLLIDELRKRLNAMGEDEDEASPVSASMEKFGLREFARTKHPQRLRGVFERLYQDACQRITRYSLIRERMLAANALCSQVMAALGQRHTEESAESIPDFERLNATASAALRGMFYQTDYLFRATCEYAMAQGIENTLFKAQRHPPEYDDGQAEDTEQPDFEEARLRNGRLPGRRSERPRKFGVSPSSTTTSTTVPVTTAPASAVATSTPTRPRKASPPPDHTEPAASFGQYVAALREANLDEEWAAARERQRERRLVGNSDLFTVKAAMEKGREASRKGVNIAGSQSLPALPKGRNMFQSPTPPASAAKLTSASTESRQL